jgi:hypothetical protein
VYSAKDHCPLLNTLLAVDHNHLLSFPLLHHTMTAVVLWCQEVKAQILNFLDLSKKCIAGLFTEYFGFHLNNFIRKIIFMADK